MTYAYLLPILVNVREIMPKRIQPTRFPSHPKHDHNATCGFHVGHVGHSIEKCNHFKARVQELINQKLMCFTLVIVEALIEERFEYKGTLIHVQLYLPRIQSVV